MIHKIDLKYYIIFSFVSMHLNNCQPKSRGFPKARDGLQFDGAAVYGGLQLIVMDPTSVSVWISDPHPITS